MKSSPLPNGLAKLALSLSLGSLFFLILMSMSLFSIINQLEIDAQTSFINVNKEANEMWSTLMSLGEGMTREKRQVAVEYAIPQSSAEYQQPYSTPASVQNAYARPNYPAPKYGYGYTKLKCCCADSYGQSGSTENLPISYKCPIGFKGPPGPQGEAGEPGNAGVPGYPGTPAVNIYPQQKQYRRRPISSAYSAANPNQYSHPQSIKLCDDPCPIGPPGPPGPKGSRGTIGHKGIRGAFGEPGRPGKPGKCGPQGDIGGRGMNGYPGPKGPNGANGVKGGKGSPGRRGLSGSIGVAGPRGLGGQSGDYGRPGLPGLCGRPGPRGPKGIDGSPGSAGAPGRPGKDALYCPCPPKTHTAAYIQPQHQPSPLYQQPQQGPQYPQQYDHVMGGNGGDTVQVPSFNGDTEASYTGLPRKHQENQPLRAVSVSYFGDSSAPFTTIPQPPAPPPKEIADYINQNFGNGEGVKRADPKPRAFRKSHRLIDWPKWSDQPRRSEQKRLRNEDQSQNSALSQQQQRFIISSRRSPDHRSIRQ